MTRKAANPLVGKKLVFVKDSWQNALTGYGTARDKMTAGAFYRSGRVSDDELSSLYHQNDLAARIVDLRPREMFRRGYELTIDGEEQDEKADALQKAARNLKVDEKFEQADIWGRLFGGCLLIVGADDGLRPDKPLDEKRIKTVRFINLVDRRFVTPIRYYGNPLAPNYGEPEVYQISSGIGGAGPVLAEVHESRCIRFEGPPADVREQQALAGWTYSALQRPYDTLRGFDSSFQAVLNLLSDASQAVFKIEGLLQMIASGEKDNLTTRMALVDQTRSSSRAVLLDAEHEDFSRQPTSFAGIPETLDRVMLRLAAAAEMPVSILMGRSPAGLNATGESDTRYFYQTIETEQKTKLKPKLLRLYRMLLLAADSPAKGLNPDDVDISFAPLWTPTDLEQAQLEQAVGARDVAYITAGVLTPEEVALSRFGSGDFSMATTIDTDARKEAMKSAVSFDPYENDPPEETSESNGGALPPPGPSDEG